MNNLFVYCEIEEGNVADVSLELLTKGRSLANQLNCQLEAVVAGSGLKDIEKQILPYGVNKLHVFDGEGLYPYTSLPHTAILVNLFKEEQPQICLMGATVIGRDLGPRVSSALTSGLTADCTSDVYKRQHYLCRKRLPGKRETCLVQLLRVELPVQREGCKYEYRSRFHSLGKYVLRQIQCSQYRIICNKRY